MYFKKFDKDSTLYNIENLNLNNKDKYLLLNNEKKKISYYLKSSCYINLNQFYQKSNFLKKELNIKNTKTEIYFDESIDKDIIKLEIVTQRIISSLNNIKNINYGINKFFNLYLPKSKILEINSFDNIINEKFDIYLNEYDIYNQKLIEWYEDNINGIGEEELKNRPKSPVNNFNICNLLLEEFINKFMIKINKKTIKSKCNFIFEINMLLKIEKKCFILEWYIDKIIIEKKENYL